MRLCENGDHADRCMPVFLPVRRLQGDTEAEGGRLLRVLFVWVREVPSGPGAAGMLPLIGEGASIFLIDMALGAFVQVGMDWPIQQRQTTESR